MKLKQVIILSLLITLPVSLLFIWWLNLVWNENITYDKINRTLKKGTRLMSIGNNNFSYIYNNILSNNGYFNENSVNIILSNSNSNSNYFNNQIPPHNLEYKKALMVFNNNIVPIKTKIRGDNFWHWSTANKSWRIKTKKDQLINSNRKVNFVVSKGSEPLSNHLLSYKLSKNLGLLTPDTELRSFSINGKFNGYRMMLEQIDENFLRKNKRMPNDIYKGDIEGQSKIKGVNAKLFLNSSIWEKESSNNHYPLVSKQPLSQLLIDIGSNNFKLYDKNSFVAFATLIDLTASFHYDTTHNWKLLYDNYYERFFPIVWDPNAWRIEWMRGNSLNLATSPLFEHLYSDYQFIVDKYYFMNEFFKYKSKDFLIIAKKQIEYEKKLLNNSLYKNSKISPDIIASLYKNIENRFNIAKEYNFGNVDKQDYKYSSQKGKIRLSVDGTKLINQIIVNGNKLNTINNIYLNYKNNGKKIRKEIEFTYMADNNQIIIDINLLANSIFKQTKFIPRNHLTFKEGTYDLEFKGFNTNNIKGISFKFLNLNREMVNIDKVYNIDEKEFKNVYNIIEKGREIAPTTWSEVKTISGFNIIKKDLIIEAGTKIIFNENATLKVLGKITAIGTKENPIIFEAKDKTKPWNALALKDARANGSIFKHCIFRDGSGDKGVLHEYTAMLSIHNVKDFLIEDCAFYDSHRTDDMVHVIYSGGKFKNTKFVRSLSDALDIDISNVTIDNCEFIDSGNDSIDLMTTNAIVTNTQFTNSLDKAISIGEGSNLLAINNHIQGSEIGMQSKDTSKAYIYNTTFVGNKKAVDAYHKNWRYSEGGTIILDSCVFKNNISNATVGKKSKVVINNSDIDTPNKFDTKSLKKKKIIINDNGFIKYDLKEPLFKDKIHLIDKKRRGYHE